MRTTTGALAILIPACAFFTERAMAQDVLCPPEPAFPVVLGNLLVTGPCEIDRKRIFGNVLIFSGGSLTASDIDVNGNLEALTAFEIDLVNSRIRGNVELVELVGDSSAIVASRLDGDVLLERNRSFLRLENNEIDSDVTAVGNTGGIDFIENEIEGDLDCRNNNPVPTGRDNDVEGDEEGQCNNLDERGDNPAPPVPPTPPAPPVPPVAPAPPAPAPPVAPPAPVAPVGEVPPAPVPQPTQPAFQSEPTGGGGGAVDPLMLAALTLLLFSTRRRPPRY